MRRRMLVMMVIVGLSGCRATSNPSVPAVAATVAARPAATAQAAPTAPTPPSAVLTIPAPLLPPGKGEYGDFSSLSADELEGLWAELHGQGAYPAAVVAGRWAVEKGADLRYNLACSLALDGQADSSFYFLQEAARLEGVDAEWAEKDQDLRMLRDDPRWSSLSAYLQQMSQYWATQPIKRASLIVPQGYRADRPIPVVVWLHGMGGEESLKGYQALSDELGLAFVGVSGSVPLGPKSFRWSEDLDRDGERVAEGLKSLSGKLKPAPGKTILFGFSQGAQLAFELAIAHPDLYRGAICLSPGWVGQESAPRSLTANSNQKFVLVAGAGEHPGNVALARQDAEWAKQRKAQARLELTKGQNQHAFPADFLARFGPWLSWVGD